MWTVCVCVSKLCVDKLCVSKLCVDKLCGDKLFVDQPSAISAMPATQSDPATTAPSETQARHGSQPSAISAMCEQVVWGQVVCQ